MLLHHMNVYGGFIQLPVFWILRMHSILEHVKQDRSAYPRSSQLVYTCACFSLIKSLKVKNVFQVLVGGNFLP